MRHVAGYYRAIRRWSFGRRSIFIFILIVLLFVSIYNHSTRINDDSTDATEYRRTGGNWKTSTVYFMRGDEWREKIISKRDSSHGLDTGKISAAFSEISGGKNQVTRTVLKAIHLAVVACGERIEEPLMMLKSAVIFGEKPLHVHVFTDDRLWPKFSESLQHWQRAITWRSFSYTLYLTNFPADQADEWRHLFKLCASQRLFIPDLLTTTDALLYVDTDVLFLRPPEDLWSFFESFNDSHIAALSPETEDASTNWYVRFARHPYYKPLGVNSGVMLMNLSRMRDFRWSDYLTPILVKYRYNITWGDQDIINIIFSANPDKLYVFGCEWNYRPDHCMYMSTCQGAEQDGISILHGSRGYFHSDKQPAFKAVYDAFKQYKLGSDLKTNFFDKLNGMLLSKTNTTCGSMYEMFLKQISAYVFQGKTQEMP